MSKNHKTPHRQTQESRHATNVQPQTQATPRRHRLPSPETLSLLLVFVLTWWWAAVWYGDVFAIAREHSFWAPNSLLMYFEQGKPGWPIWLAGRALLTLYHWTWLGGLVVAALVTLTCWALRQVTWTRLTRKAIPALRERHSQPWWRILLREIFVHLPAAAWMVWVAYEGFDAYFEKENGQLLGSLLAMAVVLGVVGILGRLSQKDVHADHDSIDKWHYAVCLSPVVMVGITMIITTTWRPYVRVVTQMERQMMAQDWEGVKETARAHTDLSYRLIAAYYAVALVQTNQQCTNLFDIRLDYDEPYLHGYNGGENNGCNYYIETCDYHSGLIETSIHHAMEQMTMSHPSLRTLKLLTKCALMRSEWAVARKYLRILKEVPFEGDFIARYSPMVGRKDLVDADPEMRQIRLTEPIHDAMESGYTKPVFLGYYADLMEGRSKNALWNSLAVNIYSKRMDAFMERLAPLAGTTLPQNVSDAVVCLSAKHPELMNQFQGMKFSRDRFAGFLREVKPYISDRERYSYELFDRYRGYYGYYYFFGNLRATKQSTETQTSSNSGVN